MPRDDESISGHVNATPTLDSSLPVPPVMSGVSEPICKRPKTSTSGPSHSILIPFRTTTTQETAQNRKLNSTSGSFNDSCDSSPLNSSHYFPSSSLPTAITTTGSSIVCDNNLSPEVETMDGTSGPQECSTNPLNSTLTSVSPSPPTSDLLLHRGQYSTLWKSTSGDRIVKAFNTSGCFENALQVYRKLGDSSHDSFLRFYGRQEPETSFLILEYAPEGDLHNFLDRSPIGWQSLVGMIQGLVSGVAFLHSQTPAISHFSLSDCSVLVTSGGRGVKVCDFSHALIFGPSQQNNRQSISHDSTSGRLYSYLAPELFRSTSGDSLSRGSNLKEYSVPPGVITESAAKHVDVYALALLLWQLASRCTELYQGIPVLEHRRPYELELGPSPAREQVRVLVSKRRARPLFPDIWKNSNPALKLLKETIAEAWDPEPEARLTALCIAERVRELPALWDKHRTEMMIACGLAESEFRDRSQKALLAAITSGHKRGVGKDIRYIINEFQTTPKDCDISKDKLTIVEDDKENFRLEKNLNWASINKNRTGSEVTLPLQPHQCRNLCIERNLYTHSTSGLTDPPMTMSQHSTTSTTSSKFQLEKRSNTVVAASLALTGSAKNHTQETRNLNPSASSSSTSGSEGEENGQFAHLALTSGGQNQNQSLSALPVPPPIQLNVQNRLNHHHHNHHSHPHPVKNCNIERANPGRTSASAKKVKTGSTSLFNLLRSRLLAISTLNTLISKPDSQNSHHISLHNNTNKNNHHHHHHHHKSPTKISSSTTSGDRKHNNNNNINNNIDPAPMHKLLMDDFDAAASQLIL